MKINVDDWHFRLSEQDTVLVDIYLENGQHSLLEVHPMKNPGDIPEIVVYGELPGERLTETSMMKRWIARPPDKQCPWSHVEVTPALMQQIHERLSLTAARQ